MADTTTLLGRYPQDGSLLMLRADLYRDLGKRDLAAADAAAIAAAGSERDTAQITAGMIYAAVGDQANLMKAFDRAIAIAPSPFAYINRSRARPWRDFAGRQTDIDAALKAGAASQGAKTDMQTIYRTDPHSGMALLAEAELQGDRRDYSGAIATLMRLLATRPSNYDAMLAMAINHARLGDEAAARLDLAKLDALKGDVAALERICRSLSQAGVLLASANANCAAAVAKAPDNLDIAEAHAFAMMRGGQTEQAIAAYGRLLAKRPSWASALYGRALAEQKAGRAAAANADRKQAIGIDPDIADRFERFGLPALPASASGH